MLKLRIITALLVALLITTVSSANAGSALVGAKKAQQMIDMGAVDLIIDVRSRSEFTGATGHLKGAIHIPINALPDRLTALSAFKTKTILIYCHSGGRSADAARYLSSNGFSSLLDLKGGIVAWGRANLPTRKK